MGNPAREGPETMIKWVIIVTQGRKQRVIGPFLTYTEAELVASAIPANTQIVELEEAFT